jgi:hypothetical protein
MPKKRTTDLYNFTEELDEQDLFLLHMAMDYLFCYK